MDKKIKKKWLKALTNGKYKQGRQVLREGDKYCCLGVLCDLVKKDVGGEWTPYDQFYYHGDTYEFDLPEDVREHVGLQQEQVDTLVCMNDGMHDEKRNKSYGKRTFKTIAKYIEKNIG